MAYTMRDTLNQLLEGYKETKKYIEISADSYVNTILQLEKEYLRYGVSVEEVIGEFLEFAKNISELDEGEVE